MMFAACASPGRSRCDADKVMSLLTKKIEQTPQRSMAATKITRELRRVLHPAAPDGFLSSKALAEIAGRTWLVGVERDLAGNRRLYFGAPHNSRSTASCPSTPSAQCGASGDWQSCQDAAYAKQSPV